MLNLKQKLVTLISLMLLCLGCNDTVTEVVNDNPSIAAKQIEREIIHQDSSTKIIKITSEEDFYYQAIVDAKSLSAKFKIQIELNSDLEIISVKVPSYIGTRGRAITGKRFSEQFIGKGSGNKLTVGEDIHSITGATQSAKTMTDQIRRIIKLIEKKSAAN